MKTTVELSDDLFAEAKKIAFLESTTLRSIIEAGIRDQIEKRQHVSKFEFPVIRNKLRVKGQIPDDVNQLIDQVREERLL
jgi:hypothetical protein